MFNNIARLGAKLAFSASVIAVLAPASFAEDKNFNGEQLVVQTYGGSIGRFFQEKIEPMFEERFNADLIMVEGQTTDVVAKMRANAGHQEFDTWMVAESGAIIVNKEGLTEQLRLENAPQMETLIAGGRGPDDGFVNISFSSTVIVYNDTVWTPEDMPTTWRDLSDPKFEGQLLLPGAVSVFSTMYTAHLGHLYGDSIENVDKAFEVLNEQAPNVTTYWTSHDQVYSLLNSGAASIAVNSSDRAVAQARSGAPVNTFYPDEGAIFIGNSVGISKGTEHRELAEAYVNFLLEPELQKLMADELGLIPAQVGVEVAADVAVNLPSGKAMESSLSPDWDKIGQLQSGWTDRYMTEITGR